MNDLPVERQCEARRTSGLLNGGRSAIDDHIHRALFATSLQIAPRRLGHHVLHQREVTSPGNVMSNLPVPNASSAVERLG